MYKDTKNEAVKYCEKNYPQMTDTFKELFHKQYLLLCQKQMDYGPSNISLGTLLTTPEEKRSSLIGVIVRMNDKVQRLLNLLVVHQRNPYNESILDSFRDVVNYGLIAQIVERGKWGK